MLWETVFGANTAQVCPFVFYAGTRLDSKNNPIYDQCVIGYGETEKQARANAESRLYSKIGHKKYYLGEKIPVI